jgi:hypothetical protein
MPLTASDDNTHYVAVLPMKAAEIDLVHRVASIIGKDLYGTRLLLAGRVPKIVARYDTREAAELTVTSLKGLGIPAITCQDVELRKPSRGFRAQSLRFGAGEITFSSKSGQLAKMELDEAFLILTGRVETSESIEVTRTKMKLNVPLTLLTGGIPVRRKVTEKATETVAHIESFVRLYGRQSPDSNIEIRQHDFDYSCLPKVAASSQRNFGDLTATIRGAFPRAVFDDSLTGNFGLGLPYTTPSENVDIICKLIYLFTRSSTRLDS